MIKNNANIAMISRQASAINCQSKSNNLDSDGLSVKSIILCLLSAFYKLRLSLGQKGL